MPFQQCAVWTFIVTCCAIEFPMLVYACCVPWKGPRRCSLEITLVTIKCETFMSVLYVMLKPGLIRGSVVTLVALLNLMNTFSVFPYFDFVCSFKVKLITTISNSLMYWLLVFPKILWRWKRKITLTASLFHMLMLTPDVLPYTYSLYELFPHSGPARRFHHGHWEANWY